MLSRFLPPLPPSERFSSCLLSFLPLLHFFLGPTPPPSHLALLSDHISSPLACDPPPQKVQKDFQVLSFGKTDPLQFW